MCVLSLTSGTDDQSSDMDRDSGQSLWNAARSISSTWHIRLQGYLQMDAWRIQPARRAFVVDIAGEQAAVNASTSGAKISRPFSAERGTLVSRLLLFVQSRKHRQGGKTLKPSDPDVSGRPGSPARATLLQECVAVRVKPYIFMDFHRKPTSGTTRRSQAGQPQDIPVHRPSTSSSVGLWASAGA